MKHKLYNQEYLINALDAFSDMAGDLEVWSIHNKDVCLQEFQDISRRISILKHNLYDYTRGLEGGEISGNTESREGKE